MPPVTLCMYTQWGDGSRTPLRCELVCFSLSLSTPINGRDSTSCSTSPSILINPGGMEKGHMSHMGQLRCSLSRLRTPLHVFCC